MSEHYCVDYWCVTKYARNLTVVLFLHLGKPYPIVLASDARGAMPYNYKLSWEMPDNGGMPIIAYEIKLRQVGTIYCKRCVEVY